MSAVDFVSKIASEDPHIKQELDDATRDENVTLGDEIERASFSKAKCGEGEREDDNEVALSAKSQCHPYQPRVSLLKIFFCLPRETIKFQ